MRRRDREVTDFDEVLRIVGSCSIIRIGLADGDYPFIVPLNFGYAVEDDVLCFYIHGASAGRKSELISKNPRCSFEMDVELRMDLMPEVKGVTTRYECIMGTADIDVLDGEDKRRGIEVLMNRYELSRGFDYSEDSFQRVMVWRLRVTGLSAKVNPIPHR